MPAGGETSLQTNWSNGVGQGRLLALLSHPHLGRISQLLLRFRAASESLPVPDTVVQPTVFTAGVKPVTVLLRKDQTTRLPGRLGAATLKRTAPPLAGSAELHCIINDNKGSSPSPPWSHGFADISNTFEMEARLVLSTGSDNTTRTARKAQKTTCCTYNASEGRIYAGGHLYPHVTSQSAYRNQRN
jgi:hypothetical protein